MKQLYLDIDGVLLGRDEEGRVQLAEGAKQFIDFALANYDCFWLTTHCKGDASATLAYQAPYCSPELIEKLKVIKPTTFKPWKKRKTQAIDFNREFVWLDDYLFNAEIAVLKKHGRLSSWHQVNSYADGDALRKCLNELRSGSKELDS